MKTRFALVAFLTFGLAFGTFSFSSPEAAANIVLQPHQKLPTEYLLKHPEQKGLLLFHSLGSGKTYIALDYAEKNPGKKVIILLPNFLKSNWITQMKSFGITDLSRYEMIPLNDPAKLLASDLSNTVVIVDEVHKLIQKIRTGNAQESESSIEIYQKLKSADKLLLLTGTPIFEETSDIAYLGNLLASEGKTDPYPIDAIKFHTEFMRIKPVTSLVRGHVTESKLMMVGIPFLFSLTAIVTLGTSLPWAVPLVALLGSATVPVVNEVIPVGQVSFREFDSSKWKDFAEKYVSYYQVKLVEDENYPSKEVVERKVLYNDLQSNFFLSFVDEDLETEELKIMLAEENQNYQDEYLKIHSSQLQKRLLANAHSGLEIGNLDFKKPQAVEASTSASVDSSVASSHAEFLESPKFLEILGTMKQSPGQVAIYSSYFKNGILRFASFLERNGFKDQYLILSPDLPVSEQINIVDQYNQASKRILLIHPDIIEGISLVGTEQLHVLEPISNSAILDQVIGRTIRYRSHSHLPAERRKVNVYLWESDIVYSNFLLPTSTGLLRRKHWQRKYSEVNPSTWSKGIADLDSTYFLKDETPDKRLKRHNLNLEKDVGSFRELLNEFNIEKSLNL